MKVNGDWDSSVLYILLCSTEQKTYRFGTKPSLEQYYDETPKKNRLAEECYPMHVEFYPAEVGVIQ